MNPYAATPPTGSPAPDEPSVRERKSRKMQFARPGKYVAQGDALRNEIKMEALRQRIAEASKKAGLDSEFDTLERSLKVREKIHRRVCVCADEVLVVAETTPARGRMVGQSVDAGRIELRRH
jgi:U4/U6 small nuclear ribonucleoprotein PRP3